MYIARILYPIEVLGPGKRIGIWFCGCKHKCKGCSNPELWEFQEKYIISLENLMELINKVASENQVDGFTITGGDPMLQYDDLIKLIPKLKELSDDILVYPGYKLEELSDKNLDGISVLIDGTYQQKLNGNLLLRGSSNQKIYILEETKQEKYKEYLSKEINRIQNFITKDGIISVGIHKPDFMKEEK